MKHNSQTYVYVKFNTVEEAKNFISYLKTRLFRITLGMMMICIRNTTYRQTRYVI